MLKAGLEKEYRDTILSHSLKGMDVHYLVIDDRALTEAMGKFTKWVDGQLESANVDHSGGSLSSGTNPSAGGQ